MTTSLLLKRQSRYRNCFVSEECLLSICGYTQLSTYGNYECLNQLYYYTSIFQLQLTICNDSYLVILCNRSKHECSDTEVFALFYIQSTDIYENHRRLLPVVH
ncbi:hypothetical protein DICVIV_12126 [Dictyocaulus viviparus]|uniref:Uncharacterized protein n=1 Tax=Dictyocaulus viviparus TaxID=29172 RepID=A0A0D8XDP9_DICVI|nr:hypothetical protein DICVIV_12126 [Dictyocaulus viviparus]